MSASILWRPGASDPLWNVTGLLCAIVDTEPLPSGDLVLDMLIENARSAMSDAVEELEGERGVFDGFLAEDVFKLRAGTRYREAMARLRDKWATFSQRAQALLVAASVEAARRDAATAALSAGQAVLVDGYIVAQARPVGASVVKLQPGGPAP